MDEQFLSSSMSAVQMAAMGMGKPVLNPHHKLRPKAEIFQENSGDAPSTFSTNLPRAATSVKLRSKEVSRTAPGEIGLIHEPQSIATSNEGYCFEEEEAAVVECDICSHPFDEDCPEKAPRNLSCGHAYCTGCLEKIIIVPDESVSPHISCPKCRSITLVRGGSASSLTKSFALIEVLRVLKSPQPSRKISHTVDTSSSDNQFRHKCPEHEDYIRSYCLKDGTLICSSCELYGAHRGHETAFLKEAAVKERKKLQMLDPEVVKQKQKMKLSLARVEGTRQEVQEAGGKMEDEVDEFFQKLVALINEKKQMAKTDIRLRVQHRIKGLTDQAKDLRECIERADAVHLKTERLLRGNDYAILQEVRLTLDQIEGIFTKPPPIAPSARNDLRCVFSSDAEEEITSSLERACTVVADAITMDSARICVNAFHDGFQISWEELKFTDNPVLSYHLQMAKGEQDYTYIYRGSASKYKYINHNLEDKIPYKFRVQVRTIEGVGNWSEPKEVLRTEPSLHWHSKWRSVKVELSQDQLEATLSGGSHWATLAADKFFDGQGQYYAEIEILSLGKPKSKETLVIGLIGCSKYVVNTIEWQNRRCPIGEWDRPSWGFLPISGLLKSSTLAQAVPYGEDLKIQAGDRIGVLVDMYEEKMMFFCNGTDLGVAFDDLTGQSFLLAVSIRDKIRIRLRFPPPPYSKRTIKLVKLMSNGHVH